MSTAGQMRRLRSGNINPSGARTGVPKASQSFRTVCGRAPMVQLAKNPPATRETWVPSLGWEGARRKERLPTPVFRPGECHGWHSPWGRGESDETERLSLRLHFSPSWNRKKKEEKMLSRVRLSATLWTVAYQASPSMRFPGIG